MGLQRIGSLKTVGGKYEFLLILFGIKQPIPGGSDGKESTCNSGSLGSIPGSGRFLGEGKREPTPVFLPGEFHGQWSLVGYSPWGRRV